ncbi:hypothetical protein [Bacillus cereus group sp. MYBK242-2]|uniref:hypothetical protein n=1 Tax=Bacillus cereus group sp. MYBK242-2 TaxID=3450647 RepID=UPI003F7AA845
MNLNGLLYLGVGSLTVLLIALIIQLYIWLVKQEWFWEFLCGVWIIAVLIVSIIATCWVGFVVIDISKAMFS